MYLARWNGAVIAQSDKTIEVEGNQYFPFDSVTTEYLVDLFPRRRLEYAQRPHGSGRAVGVPTALLPDDADARQ